MAVLVALATLQPAAALAATCTSNVNPSGNWSAAGSWDDCGGGIPGAGDTAVIATGDTITANVDIVVGAVIVDSGGTLNVDDDDWRVDGTTTISGTLTHTSSNGSSIFAGMVTVDNGGVWNNSANEANVFRGGITNNGTWTNTGNATQTFGTNSQVLAGSSPISFGGNVDISGAITVTNNNTNTVTINGRLNGSAGGSTWENGPNSTLNYNSSANSSAPMNTGTLLASANPNTVRYSRGGDQTVKASTYHHLILSGSGIQELQNGTTVNGDVTTSGTVTLGVDNNETVTINGNLNLGTGTTYDPSNGSIVLLRGNLNNSASMFNASGNTIVLDGTAVQSINGMTAFNNLTISNASAAVIVNNNITASGTLTISAGAVLSPVANVTVGGDTLTGSGTAHVTLTGTTSDFTSQYTIGKTLTNLTVEYVGTAAQTVSSTTYGGLKINTASGAALASGTTTVDGTLTLATGTLAVGAQILVLNGPAIAGTTANLITTSASSLTFGGGSSGYTGIGMPAGVTQLNNLTVNNINGITLNSSPAVAGLLTLTRGAITTGANILTTSANCPASISRPNSGGYILGKLRLSFPSGNNITCTFHVGSSSAYAPMSVTVNSGGGTLTGYTTGNEHPQIALSGIDSTKDANRYWTLGNSGDTINVGLYGVTFNFIAADLDIGATATSFKAGKYAASSWSLLTPSSALSTSTSISSIAGPGVFNAPTDFALGAAAATCDVPAGLPSNMSCVCDNFGRALLNPSTIFGGNWAATSSNGSFGSPRIVNSGYLRMTNNSTNVATAATMPGTFPAKGNLITVEFKHYAYNANGTGGADGIALTLSDATQTPVPGAYGGSLGYAQKDSSACAAGGGTVPCNGFTGGWVGIGIDEWGNFSAATEGRTGGPGQRADSVSVRGSGSGLIGYSYLGGTAANLNPPIDSPTQASPNPGHAYRIVVDARNYTWDPDTSTGTKATLVSVDRDTSGGTSYTSLVPSFDAFSVNPAQALVPDSWKLSFTGSTGSSVNYHELAALKICAQTITPPAGYRIQIDNLSPSTCGTAGGSPSSPVITVTAIDSSGNTVNTYANTVTLSATQISGANSAAVWTKKPGSANGVLSGNQYTFAASDNGMAKFYLTDASSQDVQITVSESGGAIASSTPLDAPIQYRDGMFTVVSDDALGDGVVGGRPHTMKISLTSCSGGIVSTDLGYDGLKSLDGWYLPDLSHPSGAGAPQICAGPCSSSGSCQTLSIAAPNLNATSNNLPALSFADGVASFCVRTSDVGKYSVYLRDDSNVSSSVTGASPVLTVRPFAVAVSNVNASGTANPGTTDTAGASFTSAGSTFSATVQGYLWSTGADGDGDGIPDAGASWGQLSGGGIASHYADTVKLSPGTVAAPSGGELGAVAEVSVPVTGGAGSTNALSYSEVGSFHLKAVPSTSYLATQGLDLLPRVVFFTIPTSTSQSAVVGRFRPHQFGVSNATLIPRSDFGSGVGCTPASEFTYMGEPMRVSFTLTAQNKSGQITKNYRDTFARLDGGADWTTFNIPNTLGMWLNTTGLPAVVPVPLNNTDTCSAFFGRTSPGNTTFTCTGTTTHVTVPATAPRVSATRVGASAPDWNTVPGTAIFTADVKLARANPADGPYGTTGTSAFGSLNIGIRPIDLDGTTVAGTFDMNGDGTGPDRLKLAIPATQLRFGRLRASNAHGSELLKLNVPVEAQYWSGSAFITNLLDNCTAISGNTIRMDGYRLKLAACETSVPATVTMKSGKASISLPAPGAGNNGSVDLTLFLGAATPDTSTCIGGAPASTVGGTLEYLQGNWRGAPFVDDPSVRATFGVFHSGPVIYSREMY